jgi:hypothetical protein
MARQPGAFGADPAFQRLNQRLDPFLTDGVSLLGRGAVDLALDREDLVDAPHRLDCQRHLPQIGQHEEFAPAMSPACRLGDRLWTSFRLVQFAEPGVGVRLQDTGPAGGLLPPNGRSSRT